MESLSPIVQPFALVLSRLSPLFLAVGATPLARFPGMVRLVLLLVASLAMTQLIIGSWPGLGGKPLLLALLSELGLGLLMVLGIQLTYAAVQLVGRVLDMQIGFAAAGVVDPISRNSDPLLGTIMTLFLTLIIFTANIHHEILALLLIGFHWLPPGHWSGTFSLAEVSAFFAAQLLLSLMLFGPILMALWLVDLFNGAVAKTMPQMNVYFVMLPLKIAVGLFLLAVSIPHMQPLLQRLLDNLLSWYQLDWVV